VSEPATRPPATIGHLLDLLQRLKSARIFYTLSDPTDGAIMIEVAVPGERWEIEMHEDGQIGVEVFLSSGGVQGPEQLERLFERFGRAPKTTASPGMSGSHS
jgi:hypothetical protein